LRLHGSHVAIGSVPYVTAKREIKRGLILSTLEFSQNQVRSPTDHTVWFAGDTPCNKDGDPLSNIFAGTNLSEVPVKGIAVQFRFSCKLRGGKNYPDYYAKLTTYIKILVHQAQAIDPSVTANVFPLVPVDDTDSPFKYYDTASSRAGIEALAAKLALQRIAIVGLGGTGSYVLDLVAKTPVREIHLYDDDYFEQHTAFRSPGAVGIDDLVPQLKKVNHYAALYSKLRHGVVAHDYRIAGTNSSELESMNFVFMCMDSGEEKDAIMAFMEKRDIPFIDVGMGIVNRSNALGGVLRVTTSTSRKRDHIRSKHRVSFAPAVGKNDYSRNIQVADLNALNAALAVIKWKKLFGFYHDLKSEHHSTFVIETNKFANDDML
jgi:hypothetical protein